MSDDQQNINELEIVQVMSSESGRHVMHRILEVAGVDDNTFNADSHLHAKNAGRREVGLWLREEIQKADMNGYLTMLKENKNG
jgi:hypothetical protein